MAATRSIAAVAAKPMSSGGRSSAAYSARACVAPWPARSSSSSGGADSGSAGGGSSVGSSVGSGSEGARIRNTSPQLLSPLLLPPALARLLGCDGAFSATRTAISQMARVSVSVEYIEHGYKELSMTSKAGGAAGEHRMGRRPRERFE